MHSIFVRSLLLFLFATAPAWSATVVPAVFTNTAGNGATTTPLFVPPDILPRYQQVYDAAELQGILNQQILAISFRLDEFDGDTTPGGTFTDLGIRLSTTQRPVDGLLSDLDQNVGADEVEVFSGSFALPQLEGDQSPNPFDLSIPFDQSFTYTGGNLLLEIRPFGAAILGSMLDAADSTTDGVSRAYFINGAPTSDSVGLVTKFIVPEPTTGCYILTLAFWIGTRRRVGNTKNRSLGQRTMTI
jgi:hypothetical protein